jgi:hypothetical protein
VILHFPGVVGSPEAAAGGRHHPRPASCPAKREKAAARRGGRTPKRFAPRRPKLRSSLSIVPWASLGPHQPRINHLSF